METSLDESAHLLATSSPAGLGWFTNWNPETQTSKFALPGHLLLLNQNIQALVAGDESLAGKRGIIVEMPPRHGKSETCSHYTPAWFLGLFPDKSVALASYESDFAATWGRKARDLLERHGRKLFNVDVDRRSSAADRWNVRRHGVLTPETGGMVTTGIGGPLTGRGADLLIIDDPVKNAAEAGSRARRQSIWDWWVSTALTRLEPGAVVLIVMTRWHDDDLAGRLQKEEPDMWEVLSLPAIAREVDALGREPGQALWPERFDELALAAIRKSVGTYVWEALYQQRPAGFTGGVFERDNFLLEDEVSGRITKSVRRWDLAATEGSGDYTAGVKLEKTADGTYWITDVKRGRWSPETVERVIRETAANEPTTKVRMEQERGGAGKSLVDHYRRLLAGRDFRGKTATGDKEVRAQPYAAAVERGDVRVLRRAWTDEFLNEHAFFPRGAHDDQVDAAAGAFEDLSSAGTPVSY